MKTSNLSILFFVMLNIAGFTQEVNSCYSNINCKEFNLMLETKDAVLIDVRSYKLFKNERIKDACFAPDRNSLIELLKNYDKNTYILIYCEEGKRSKTAAQIVCNELKFTNVYNLVNGIKKWKSEGYDVEKEVLNEDTN